MENLSECQGSVSPSEIRILNYSNGETIDYPFVLLECEVTRNESQPSAMNDVAATSASTTDVEGTTDHLPDSVLVESQTECRYWPVIHGGFKALVQLNAGENLIKIKACINGSWSEKDFKLTYIPSTLKRFVRVVYIKCSDSDGSFEAPPGVANDVGAAVKRLAFNARLLQTFTAQDLHQHGFGHRTFKLEEDSEGNPMINVFTSSLTTDEARKMTGGQLYDKFSPELSESNLHDPLCKFWAFMSCTHYDPPPPEEFNERDIHLYVKAHTALGGGQLALFGTGGLHTWASSTDELSACFMNTKMIDRHCLFDDSSRRGSYWANYATGLGASMHELGHCFDLAHTPGGIMGRGFDDFNCVFSLWKNPPPSHSGQETVLKVGSDSEETIKENAIPGVAISDAAEKMVVVTIDDPHDNGVAITAKGLVVSPGISEQPQQLQEVSDGLVASHEKQALDWTKNSANLARPGDLSHGAKWHRSSAVILRYHSWFSPAEEPDITINQPIVHWNSSTYGPVGNMSDSYQCNSTYFHDKKWLQQHNATLGGYVIHAGTYVNSIQTIGRVVTVEDGVEKVKEIFSRANGTITGRKYVFRLDEPDEHVTAMDVRAGAWIDAIRIHTNYKSSVLMGGEGGCFSHFESPEGQRIVGMFGCAGSFVGSLAIVHESFEVSIADPPPDEDLIIYAPNGLRLIELHNEKHGEVCRHWEFLEPSPPTRFALNRDEIVTQKVRVLLQDDLGNIRSSGPFCDLDKMFASVDTETHLEVESSEDRNEEEENGIEGKENEMEKEESCENVEQQEKDNCTEKESSCQCSEEEDKRANKDEEFQSEVVEQEAEHRKPIQSREHSTEMESSVQCDEKQEEERTNRDEELQSKVVEQEAEHDKPIESSEHSIEMESSVVHCIEKRGRKNEQR